MSSCPTFNEADAMKVLKMGGLSKEDFKICPTMEGGRKKKGSRKMRGGWPPNQAQIRMGLWLFIAIIVGFVGYGADKQTVLAGIRMLFNGQCNSISEFAMNFIGFGNPICRTWQMLLTAIGLAFVGNAAAIAQLVGLVVAIFTAPMMAAAAVNRVAGQITNGINLALGPAGPAIENGQAPLPALPPIPNDRMEAAAGLLQLTNARVEGGRTRKSRRHKIRKNKSRKNKSRRH